MLKKSTSLLFFVANGVALNSLSLRQPRIKTRVFLTLRLNSRDARPSIPAQSKRKAGQSSVAAVFYEKVICIGIIDL